jgi:oligoendopeptidase F
MNLLPFSILKAFEPRRFVPNQIDLGDWDAIAPLFDTLETQASACKTADALEKWLLDWSELRAALDEESSRRYIAMTCHTDAPEAERAYLEFVEKIDPQLKPRQFRLEQIYLAHPLRSSLPRERYLVFERNTRQHVELYRTENVVLETDESRLSQQYQKLCGTLTVEFQGGEKTLIQMGRYLEEPDRALRQKAWESVAGRRLQEADKFDEQFDGLIALRGRIAANAGFANYMEYAFQARGRFDYKPEDCLEFHSAIEREVVPLLKKLQADRKKRLGLSALRPWDLSVDPKNRPALRPFKDGEQLATRTQTIFDRLDPKLGREFATMRNLHLLDLENRKGKAPGGYQCSLAEARLPFIFMNAVGMQRDVETLLHEGGHAFHAMAAQGEDFYPYREAPIEFCEVASMSMELLGNDFLDVFHAPAECERARRNHLEGIVDVLPWIATVDAFQHWIYTHPGHSREERGAAWMELTDRFGGDVDWSGFEEVRKNLWHRQLHIFIHPFYYVEYGIAQLGALQIWAHSRENHVQALADYHRGLSLGGSRPLPELFEAAGCRFDFSASTVRPLIQLVDSELEKLDRH